MVGARVRRQQVAYTRSRGLSDRRACVVLSVARSALGYQSRLAVRDAPALAAMRRLAAQYPRYGYRRIRVFLRREVHVMSPDRAHRLWRHAGLQVPRRRCGGGEHSIRGAGAAGSQRGCQTDTTAVPCQAAGDLLATAAAARVKGGTKLDQMAEENQTTWPLGRVSENGCAKGCVRMVERQRRGGRACCVRDDSCRRSAPGCGRDESADRAARQSAVRSRRSRSIR